MIFFSETLSNLLIHRHNNFRPIPVTDTRENDCAVSLIYDAHSLLLLIRSVDLSGASVASRRLWSEDVWLLLASKIGVAEGVI